MQIVQRGKDNDGDLSILLFTACTTCVNAASDRGFVYAVNVNTGQDNLHFIFKSNSTYFVYIYY